MSTITITTDEAPQQPTMPMPGAGAMPRTTIKQFQQLTPPTFYGTPDPMAAESWLLGIERVFEVLPCTDEQKVVFATFMFEGAALIWWQLKKPLEPLWLWPRFLEARRFEAGLRWNIKNKVEILRLPTHQEVLHAALIAEESLNEMSQFRENRKKRIGGNGECRMGSRACYGCGQEGHQIRDCPMKSKIQGAGTSASASIRQPSAERRNNQPRQGRAFALVPGNTPTTTSVVSGILPICGQPAHILMDSGSTHSFVSNSFEHYLTTSPVSLEYELSVSLPSGDSMLCDRIYNSCEIRVNDVPMYVDLIPLEMHGFDVILRMDWLSSYRALIDCELKRVVFHSFAHSGLIFEGVGVVPSPYLISSMKARRLIRKGSQAFLCK
ncbi:hypothetical protein Acr_00g0070780 [Actinidia rufa]|uniref:CCHC-type domain-containing protein n=1 Tax=Actinidia rufa TaxID=165716 RepID=A0A7J0DRU2_9ERIC|nr:hypothetical protein Acr_00g0070780 [Actinidia rufa]